MEFIVIDGLAGVSAVLLTLIIFLASKKKISLLNDYPNLTVPTVLLALLSLLSIKVSIAGLLLSSLFFLKGRKKEKSG